MNISENNEQTLADVLATQGMRMIIAGSDQADKFSPEEIKRLTGADSIISRGVSV